MNLIRYGIAFGDKRRLDRRASGGLSSPAELEQDSEPGSASYDCTTFPPLYTF